MIDTVVGQSTESLRALVASLARVDEQVTDAERIDQLALLEALKAAAAAAQVRVTVGFVASQEQIADGWREHAKACSDSGDFDGWRQARDHAARASLEDPGRGRDADQNEGSGENSGGGSDADSGDGSGRSRRKRPVLANGIAAQVALARAESPHRGSQHVSLALTLDRHLPNVMEWLTAGVLSEWRATLIVRECSVLSGDLQQALDAELAETLGEGIGRLGDRQLVGHVKAIAYRLDPESVANRARKAEGDRRVSLRPAPDTMAYLTALLPVAQAVAAYAALTQAADTARAAGDERGKGQVMADTLVERVTGQASAEDVDVEVQVVITDDALFGDDETPGQVPGYGTVPAGWVRDLLTPNEAEPDVGGTRYDDVRDAGGTGCGDTATAAAAAHVEAATPACADVIDASTRAASGRRAAAARDTTQTDRAGMREHARVWIRRLYTHPTTSQLVAMDSTRRVYDGGLRRYLLARDGGTCRTPWCDAPIRHLDHITDHPRGGPTTATNGQGLCVRCNHTKQLPGVTARTIRPEPRQPGAPHTVETDHPHRDTPTDPPHHPSSPERSPRRNPASPASSRCTPPTHPSAPSRPTSPPCSPAEVAPASL